MSAPLTVSIQPTPTRPRTTPPPADRRFGEHLAGAAETVGRVATSLAGVPELASVRIATAATGPRAAAPAAPRPADGPLPAGLEGGLPASGAWGAPPTGADASLYYLQLQERVSAEHRRYTTLSNLMKARHETAKVAINNIL